MLNIMIAIDSAAQLQMTSARQICELFHSFKKQIDFLDEFYSFRGVSAQAHLDSQISGGDPMEGDPIEGDPIEGDPIERATP